MWDYRAIKTESGLPISPAHIREQHTRDRIFLEKALSRETNMRRVVVTHHLPSARSIAPRFAHWPTNASYASHLDDVIETHAPDLWIHGHTHAFVDYTIGRTRVVCNAHGYMKGERRENPDFREGFMIAIDHNPLGSASAETAIAD